MNSLTTINKFLEDIREKSEAATKGPWLMGDDLQTPFPPDSMKDMRIPNFPADKNISHHFKPNVEFWAFSRSALSKAERVIKALLEVIDEVLADDYVNDMLNDTAKILSEES